MRDVDAESVHPGFVLGAGLIVLGAFLEAFGLYGPLGFVMVLLGAAFFIEGEFRR